MRRAAALFCLALLLLVAACTDQRAVQPTAPAVTALGVTTASVTGSATDSVAIEGLIRQLYYRDDDDHDGDHDSGDDDDENGVYKAARTRWRQIARLYTNCTLNPPQSPCDSLAARSNTYDLTDDIIVRFKAGKLNPLPRYSSPAGSGTPAAVTDLVNLLFRYVGIDALVCSFATDCNSTVYRPGSAATTLVTPSGQAGIALPAGAGTVTQPTVISVSRIVDNAVRLTTQLDQYTYRYVYTSSSGEGSTPDNPFGQFVTVEVCLEPGQTFPPGAESRLALAHDVAEPAPYQNIQILPPAAGGFLGTCGGLAQSRNFGDILASLLLPRPLQASVLLTTGTTGQSKTLSPFGAVDTLGFITPVSDTVSSAPDGGSVPAPRVRLVSPAQRVTNDTNGPGMAGIPVTFTTTAGTGCFDTSCGGASPTTLTVTTDAHGFAAVPAWTVGAGANTVRATASIPCAAPVAAGTPTDCGAIVTTGLAAAQFFQATGNPPVKLSFSVQPSTLVAGASFGVTVLAQDAFGNTVPAFASPKYAAGVTLTLTAANGATLSGLTTLNATAGVATFSGLSITKAGSGYTITAAAAGLTSAVSSAFSVQPGAASAISIQAGNDQTAVEGTTLGVAPSTVAPAVQVTDAYGNPVPGAGVTFTSASGGASVGSPAATTNAAGVASTSWTIVAGTNTLNASITALGPLPFVAFTATGTSATKVLLSCAPSNGNGDEVTRAFYVNKLGKSIKQVTLYLASNDPANVPTGYQVQLLLSADSYGATPFATSTVNAVLNGKASQNQATNFLFNNVAIPGGTKNVAFQFRVLNNPNGAKLFFALSGESCPSLTETSGTTPLPLGTALRKGVGIRILGTPTGNSDK